MAPTILELCRENASHGADADGFFHLVLCPSIAANVDDDVATIQHSHIFTGLIKKYNFHEDLIKVFTQRHFGNDDERVKFYSDMLQGKNEYGSMSIVDFLRVSGDEWYEYRYFCLEYDSGEHDIMYKELVNATNKELPESFWDELSN